MTRGHNAGRMRSAALAAACGPVSARGLGSRPARVRARASFCGQAGRFDFPVHSTRNQPNRPQNQSRPGCNTGQASGICRAASGARLSRARRFVPAIRVRPIRVLVILLRRMGPGRPAYVYPGQARRATWATGSISTAIFPSRNRSGCCAATPASAAFLPPTSSG